jgi:hypothetical protein
MKYLRLEDACAVLMSRGYAENLSAALGLIAEALRSAEMRRWRIPEKPEIPINGDWSWLHVSPTLDIQASTIVARCKAKEFPWFPEYRAVKIEMIAEELDRLWPARPTTMAQQARAVVAIARMKHELGDSLTRAHAAAEVGLKERSKAFDRAWTKAVPNAKSGRKPRKKSPQKSPH